MSRRSHHHLETRAFEPAPARTGNVYQVLLLLWQSWLKHLKFTAIVITILLVGFSIVWKLRRIDFWDLRPNTYDSWKVVEHADGRVYVGRGDTRMDYSTAKALHVSITLECNIAGMHAQGQATPLTQYISKKVRLSLSTICGIGQQDHDIRMRLLGHLAKAFPDQDIAHVIAAGGGTFERYYWNWFFSITSFGLTVSGILEVILFFWIKAPRVEYDEQFVN